MSIDQELSDYVFDILKQEKLALQAKVRRRAKSLEEALRKALAALERYAQGDAEVDLREAIRKELMAREELDVGPSVDVWLENLREEIQKELMCRASKE